MAQDGKKYFDIASPQLTPPMPKIQDANHKMLIKTNESIDDDNQAMDDRGETESGNNHQSSEPAKQPVSHPDFNNMAKIVAEKLEDIPQVNPINATPVVAPEDSHQKTVTNDSGTEESTPDAASSISNIETVTHQSKSYDSITAAKEPFVAIDALPDPGEKATQEIKDQMQDPKVFDTKEYYVPIGNTHHKHNHLVAALMFGFVCAMIIIGLILYYIDRVVK